MSFKCSETEKIFHGRFSKKLPQGIQLLAARKLTMLHFAKSLTDLRIPPANRLEALSGNRAGQHAIRQHDIGPRQHQPGRHRRLPGKRGATPAAPGAAPLAR